MEDAVENFRFANGGGWPYCFKCSIDGEAEDVDVGGDGCDTDVLLRARVEKQ